MTLITQQSCSMMLVATIQIKILNRNSFVDRAGLSIPEALSNLSIGGPLLAYVEDQKKRSSPPQIVEFECISECNFDY